MAPFHVNPMVHTMAKLLTCMWWTSAYVGLLLPVTAQPANDWRVLQEESEPQFTITFALSLPLGRDAGANVAFNYKDPKNHYYLRLSQAEAVFHKVIDGVDNRLGYPGDVSELTKSGKLTVAIKRRAWEMTAVCNREVVARGYHDQLSGGRILSSLDSGVSLSDFHYQPIEDVVFGDNFMRTDQDTSQWQSLKGTWRVGGLDEPRLNPEMSANPFLYEVKPDESGQALCATGYWFWDDYFISVATRPTAGAVVGVCAYLQDSGNYLLFRCESSLWGRGKSELVRVEEGKETVLASQPRGLVADQWYELRLRVKGGDLEGFVDGALLCRAKEDGFGQGKVGLWLRANPSRADRLAASFDDCKVGQWYRFADDFAVPTAHQWLDYGGTWQTDRKLKERVKLETGDALTVTGGPDWTNYTHAATVRPVDSSGVGLCFCFRDPKNYYLFLWEGVGSRANGAGAAGSGRKALIRVKDGVEKVLAEKPGGYQTGKAYHLSVECDESFIRASIEKKLVLEAFDGAFDSGKVGLFARGERGARFDDVVMSFLDSDRPSRVAIPDPTTTEVFTRDRLMGGWASAAGSWQQGADGTYWHEGRFFGDSFVSIAVPEDAQAGRVTLAFGSPQAASTSRVGLALRVDLPGSDQPARWMLTRSGQVLSACGSHGIEARGKEIRLARRGSFISARLDDKPFAFVQDADAANSHCVGIKTEGFNLDFRNVAVGCAALRDDSFASAPVHWYSTKGVWQVTQRWTCSPQWSFFGGTHSISPTLWSKESFEGDMVVECYLSTPMDVTRGERNPADLNVSICGNGWDLSSGYSFVYAGGGDAYSRSGIFGKVLGKTTAIYRRDERVKAIAYFPPKRNVHQEWFHIRIERTGGHLTYLVDGARVLEYDDPEPLQGGRVAFWTMNGGLVIARARIWHQNLEPALALPDSSVEPIQVARPTAAPTPTNDFESSLGTWTALERREGAIIALDDSTKAEGRRCLRVQNVASGGDFTVWATQTPFDVRDYSLVKFAYRLPPTVRVNLYAQVDGVWWEVGLAADPNRRTARVLGTIEGVVADDQWHRAIFNLGQALSQKLGARGTKRVEALAFAAPNVQYLRAGFGGNHAGATYYLDDFVLGK